MLTIIIPSLEFYDERKEEFIYTDEHKLVLEHSLVSISKWESRWHKPFLSKSRKTTEETIDYVKCMTITQNVPDEVYERLTNQNINEINKYIEDGMTATVFSGKGSTSGSSEFITSELIYFWMVSFNIPSEYQKWHLNRLLTLIRICEEKNKPKKKMSRSEIANRNKALNEMRKKQLNSKG